MDLQIQLWMKGACHSGRADRNSVRASLGKTKTNVVRKQKGKSHLSVS